MFKAWLKQLLAVCLCVLILLTPFSQAYADDYEKDSRDGDSVYYIVDGKSVKSLFDFGIKDVKNIVDWILQFHSYTVIKKYSYQGEDRIKIYFNTPNLQTLVKNKVTSIVEDGYTDDTYKPEDTEWVIPVGHTVSKEDESVITKYGFKIPNYTYMGEYPKLTMSVANIIPNPKEGFWAFVWRVITSIFGGASFLKAPDADNYNTLTYLNHTYTDRNNYLIDFFKQYYIKYFRDCIITNKGVYYDEDDKKYKTGTYFVDENEVIDLTVPESVYQEACDYTTEHRAEYNLAKEHVELWEDYQRDGKIKIKPIPAFGNHYDNIELFLWENHIEYYTSLEPFNKAFRNWIYEDPERAREFARTLLLSSVNNVREGYGYNGLSQRIMHDGLYVNSINLGMYGFTADDWVDSENYEYSAIFATDLLLYLEEFVVYHITYDETNDVEYTFTDKTDPSKKYTFLRSDYVDSILDNVSKKETYEYAISMEGRNYIYGAESPNRITIPGIDEKVSKAKEYRVAGTGLVSAFNSDYRFDVKELMNNNLTFKKESKFAYSTALSQDTYEKFPLEKSASDYNITEKLITTYGNYKVEIGTYDSSKRFKKMNYSIDDFHHLLTEILNFNNSTYTYTEEDFVSVAEKQLIETFDNYDELIDKHIAYRKRYKLGVSVEDALDDKIVVNKVKQYPWLYYKQCMIESMGGEGTCWSTAYTEEKTTITLAEVYIYSGIWKITKDIEKNENHRLTDAQASLILNTLNDYCGPYYSQVLQTMVKLMCINAEGRGDYRPSEAVMLDDQRIMPFDVASMSEKDKVNYEVTDPRVEIYKSHIIGGLVSDLTINVSFGIFIKPQTMIINIAGRITELSVFMQQICSLEFLDSVGLSPTEMWTHMWVFLLLGSLVIFFLIKTIISIIKIGPSSLGKLITAFVILCLELGFILSIYYDPQSVWGTISKATNFVSNLGETASLYSNKDLQYLYGSSENPHYEVNYYLPYLDIWSVYNTGYGLLDPQQKINYYNKEKEPEVTDFTNIPKIAGRDVKHWSVILADAFDYYGQSDSIVTAFVDTDGTRYNGSKINNNAYRVVDHFLAPRVTIVENVVSPENAFGVDLSYTKSMSLSVKENENYNGKFQGNNGLTLFVKLLNVCLTCFLSLVKMLTFMWFWFMLYIFLFKMLLGRGVEGKPTSRVVGETLAPLLALMCIGIYNGMIMYVGMNADGVLGIFLILFLFWLSFVAIRWWHNLRHGAYFPLTLMWLYYLTSAKQAKRHRNSERMALQSQQHALQSGETLTEEEQMSFAKRTEHYFEEDGSIKKQYRDNAKYNDSFEDWYRFAYNHREVSGQEWTATERRAIDRFEKDERYADIVRDVQRERSHKNKKDNRNTEETEDAE